MYIYIYIYMFVHGPGRRAGRARHGAGGRAHQRHHAYQYHDQQYHYYCYYHQCCYHCNFLSLSFSLLLSLYQTWPPRPLPAGNPLEGEIPSKGKSLNKGKSLIRGNPLQGETPDKGKPLTEGDPLEREVPQRPTRSPIPRAPRLQRRRTTATFHTHNFQTKNV